MNIEKYATEQNTLNVCHSFFELKAFSGMLECFLGYLMLLLSVYSMSTQHIAKEDFSNKNGKTVAQVKKHLPDYYFTGSFSFMLASILVFNEEYHLNVTSPDGPDFVITGDYLSFVTKEFLCVTVLIFFTSLRTHNTAMSLKHSFEYTSFILAGVMGSLLLCSSGDLMTAFLALELQGIAFCFMVAVKKNSSHAADGSLKYFITSAFASSFFLLGSSFIYLSLGTVTFTKLNIIITLLFVGEGAESPSLTLARVGLLVLAVSILIKLAAAPFHFWSIDVYESAPASTAYFFSAVPKIALFTLLHRVFYSTSFVLLVSSSFYALYCLVAISCVLFGSLGGLEQRRLKSLMAYSSVSHVGYILLSFGSGNELSPVMMYCYLVFYTMAVFCFWLSFIFLKPKRPEMYKSKGNKEIGDLTLLFKSNPVLALFLGLSLFSMTGVPPLVGFLAKFGVFTMPVGATGFYVVLLAAVVSVLPAFFYLRLTKVLFFENTAVGVLHYPVTSKNALLIVTFSFGLVLVFLKPAVFYLAADKACLLFL